VTYVDCAHHSKTLVSKIIKEIHFLPRQSHVSTTRGHVYRQTQTCWVRTFSLSQLLSPSKFIVPEYRITYTWKQQQEERGDRGEEKVYQCGLFVWSSLWKIILLLYTYPTSVLFLLTFISAKQSWKEYKRRLLIFIQEVGAYGQGKVAALWS
jgi:hypothetical protein